MSYEVNRRSFMKQSLAASAGGVLAMNAGKPPKPREPAIKVEPNSKAKIPMGKIGKLEVSRMLLGGNLLTHYTHSRDLKYVYNLCAHYNTEDKIHETMAIAEAHGINTLSIHNPPGIVVDAQALPPALRRQDPVDHLPHRGNHRRYEGLRRDGQRAGR